jgi:hypothetical protein
MKKAQAWGLDLMIAFVIFLVVLFAFSFYVINLPGEGEETLELLSYDGSSIMNSILSNGYPEDWNSNTKIPEKIGILNEGKINNTKLSNFYFLTQSDYVKTKAIFNTKYEYYFFLDKNFSITMPIGTLSVMGIGKPGYNVSKINDTANNLFKVVRFTIYEDKPRTAYLYIWS